MGNRSSFGTMLMISMALAVLPAAAQSAATPGATFLVPPSMIDSSSAWGASVLTPSACAAALPPEGMERQAVFLDARMAPSTSMMLTDQADLIASDVATTMHALLTTPNSPLASAAAKMKFYSVPAELIVVARPNSMVWRGTSESLDSTAFTILSTALDTARKHGGAVMLWPENLRADSLVIRLSLLPQDFHEAPLAGVQPRRSMRFPAFASPTPKLTPPRLQSDPPRITYPHTPASDRLSAIVTVEYVIDTTGHAVMSTFHDVWPADLPRLSGTNAAYYEQTTGSIKAFVARASYSSGRLGTCKLPVRWQSTYNLDGTMPTDRYTKWD